MPYPQDLVGKTVFYSVPGDGGPVVPNTIVDGVLTGRTIVERVLVQSTANVLNRAAAPFPMPPWSFVFLRYMPGYVTVAQVTGNLLTGPMSGCYIFKYTEAATTMIAHVGTATYDSSELSVNAKQAWLNFAARPAVTNIVGGKPDDYFKPAEVIAMMPNGAQIPPQVCCYFDGTSFYSMVLVPQPQAQGTHVKAAKIADVRRMTMQPWSTISSMRTFQTLEAGDAPVKDRAAFKLA